MAKIHKSVIVRWSLPLGVAVGWKFQGMPLGVSYHSRYGDGSVVDLIADDDGVSDDLAVTPLTPDGEAWLALIA